MLARFSRQFPAVRLDATVDTHLALRDQIDAGLLDLLVAQREPGHGDVAGGCPEAAGRLARVDVFKVLGGGWGAERRELTGVTAGASSRLRLARDQLALALDAPAVAGQRAVGADHAMAGNRQRDVWRMRAPRRAPPPASRCVRRPAHRWRWRQPESRAAPTRGAGRRCRAHPAAGSGPATGLRRSPPPRPPSVRTRRRRRSGGLLKRSCRPRTRCSGSSCSAISQMPMALAATNKAPASIAPRRSGCPRPRHAGDRLWASCPAWRARLRKSARWN